MPDYGSITYIGPVGSLYQNGADARIAQFSTGQEMTIDNDGIFERVDVEAA